MRTTTDSKPWFKYFWPWVFIFIIFWTLMSGVGMIYFSSTSPPSVIKNYHKIAKIISEDNSMQQNAEKLGVKANLILNDDLLLIDINPKKYLLPTDLEIIFVHPTDEKQDYSPEIIPAETLLKVKLAKKVMGWQVILRDNKFQWQLSNKLDIVTELR